MSGGVSPPGRRSPGGRIPGRRQNSVVAAAELTLQALYEQLAEAALATGRTFRCIIDGAAILVVPDVVVIEMAAQGYPLPDGPRLQRSDGRSVAVLRDGR